MQTPLTPLTPLTATDTYNTMKKQYVEAMIRNEIGVINVKRFELALSIFDSISIIIDGMAVNCVFFFKKVSELPNAIELKWTEPTTDQQLYVALIPGTRNTHLNGEITSFVAKHKPPKSNSDVTLLCMSSIQNYTMDCIPQSINSTFPYLTRLFIINCGLKELSRKSLIGFERLTTLIINTNPITSLPKDLLVDMPCLKVIVFQNNQLKFVDSQMLAITKNKLLHVDFRSNPTINEYYSVENPEGSVSFAQLMYLIDAKCKKPNLQLNVDADFFVQGNKELWDTGMLSDFVIETDLNEFKVHKTILAAGSPVFAAMFSTKMKENQDNRMIIKDFSPDDVRDFLRFLYFGSVASSINAVEIFKLAEKYDVRDLKYFCETLLLDIIQDTNAVEILELGTLYSNDALKNEAFRKIKISLPGKSIPCHWIDQPERLKRIMDTKLLLDSLLRESGGGDA